MATRPREAGRPERGRRIKYRPRDNNRWIQLDRLRFTSIYNRIRKGAPCSSSSRVEVLRAPPSCGGRPRRSRSTPPGPPQVDVTAHAPWDATCFCCVSPAVRSAASSASVRQDRGRSQLMVNAHARLALCCETSSKQCRPVQPPALHVAVGVHLVDELTAPYPWIMASRNMSRTIASGDPLAGFKLFT